MHKLIIETTAKKCDQKNDGPSFLTEIVQFPAGVNEVGTKPDCTSSHVWLVSILKSKFSY